MRRIKCTVQYDGTDFAGFQYQPDQPTVQGELETALRKVVGGFQRFGAASRTDAGVHALGQAIAFSTDNPIPLKNLIEAVNDHLPPAIDLLEAEEVAAAFDPRRAATSKLYSYRILNRQEGSPFIARVAWHLPDPWLNLTAMREAAAVLKGQHDFAAFRSAGSRVVNTVREITRLDIRREEDVLEFYVQANGFLYHMVRNIVGALVEVGMERRTPEEIESILESGDRSRLGPPAPPQGLCLVRVFY
ncbi:MAG: tRNA pseudouridine(38-40) synthase TruA [candidate division WS1 bacterium]|nr:tRNA pseudouridine(38-40) synthase TruA [candidate division WS1 bacterium]